MPIKNDIGLPIEPIKVSGPFMDAWESRKEGVPAIVTDSCGCVFCDIGLAADATGTHHSLGHEIKCTAKSE